MEKDINTPGILFGGQFLTFRLDQEIYGVPIDSVREVLDIVPVTRVPGTAGFLKGVINLRGAVVPVADVRVKFGMGAAKLTENSCIIVVELEISAEDGKIIVGLLADQVMEVADLSDNDIQPPPEMGTGLSAHLLRGLGKVGDDFFMILNVDEIINDSRLESSLASYPSSAGRDNRQVELVK